MGVPTSDVPVEGSDTHSRRKNHNDKDVHTHRDQQQRDRIQHVFFRGMRHLPWVKQYAMLALGLLRQCGIMGDAECKAVYEGMVDKGMRIVYDLDD